MCESSAFIRRAGREEKLLDDVAAVFVRGETIELVGVLGNRVSVRAELAEIDLMAHRLLLHERPAQPDPTEKRGGPDDAPGEPGPGGPATAPRSRSGVSTSRP